MSDDRPRKCGYCGANLADVYAETAGGRPYCPKCGKIPKAYQRDHEESDPV